MSNFTFTFFSLVSQNELGGYFLCFYLLKEIAENWYSIFGRIHLGLVNNRKVINYWFNFINRYRPIPIVYLRNYPRIVKSHILCIYERTIMTLFRKPGLFLSTAFRCNAGHTPTCRTKPAGPSAGRGGGARLPAPCGGLAGRGRALPAVRARPGFQKGPRRHRPLNRIFRSGGPSRDAENSLRVCISTIMQFSPLSTERT